MRSNGWTDIVSPVRVHSVHIVRITHKINTGNDDYSDNYYYYSLLTYYVHKSRMSKICTI
jgi:hypothetical protein